MHIIKTAALMLALASSLTANASSVTLKHKSLECAACHAGGKFTPPDAQACLGCHQETDIAKATEHFNFESYFKDPRDGKELRSQVAINPHDSFHYGRTDQCVNCHREHRSSTVTCALCHDIEPWKMNAPR